MLTAGIWIHFSDLFDPFPRELFSCLSPSTPGVDFAFSSPLVTIAIAIAMLPQWPVVVIVTISDSSKGVSTSYCFWTL